MNYFEFRDKRPAWDVIEWPQIEVTEKQLTDEEIEQWTQTVSEHSKPSLCWPVLLPWR